MSAVVDAISGGRGPALFLLSIAFPNSQTVRVASAPFSSATGGHYKPLVLQWGTIDYSISDRGGRTPAVETRVRISDTDRTIGRIVSGAYSDSVRGSTATIYLATPSVASSSWLTVFSGVVAKVSFPEPFVAEVVLRVKDDQLQRVSGKPLTRVQFPNAEAAVFDKIMPVAYGVHDASTIQTGPGLIPCLYVDKIGFRYLVCFGKAKSVDRVYVDGAQTGSGWTTVYETVNGRICTLIDFTTDQGTAEITVDVNGFESVGDGSGSTITNPATQWAHRLTNFVFGDYMSGSWASTNSLIDSTSLASAESFLTSLSAKGSDYDDQKRTGTDITARFATSFRMLSYWTFGGKVAIGRETPEQTPYSGTTLRWYKDEHGQFQLEQDDWNVTSRTLVRQARSASQGSYLTAFEVVDASITEDKQEALDLEVSEAR